jgi:hypothetical protein
LSTTVSCFAEQVLLCPEFSAAVQISSLVRGAPPSAPTEFQVLSQVPGDALFLFVSSLFENSAAPSPQRNIGQVQAQVSVQVSKDILSEFISSLFASSCSLIAQESIGQVKFSADDVVPSSSPKLFPGLTPEGVSVERDVGVGRESVGGYASASDSCPPP